MDLSCTDLAELARVQLSSLQLGGRNGAAVPAQFEIYLDTKGEFRWRFKSDGNYKTIAVSSEGYTYKSDCQRSVEIVRKQASSATVEDLTQSRAAYSRW